VEYESAEAHVVSFDLRDKNEAKSFKKHAAKEDTIAAMRAAGYDHEVRRVILNQITMAMVSDCLHHLYEAFRCLEKRKVVVALNLLRKPLTDSLLYMSWMLGDEEEFYRAFTTDSPRGITSSILKSRRGEIISRALAATAVVDVLTSKFIDETIFSRSNDSGFQKLFQHAVHLITVQHMELETTAENLNSIFKNYADDDLYELVYDVLPHVMLYIGHVVIGLFERIKPPEAGGKKAYEVRSILGLYLVEGGENEAHALERLAALAELTCPECNAAFKVTAHNAGRLVLSESYRCTECRRTQPFPFSWMFES
jgi:hypothetical protein